MKILGGNNVDTSIFLYSTSTSKNKCVALLKVTDLYQVRRGAKS